MTENAKYPVLRKDNYLLWARTAKLRLKKKKVWTVVDGTWVKPANENDLELWDTANDAALLFIHNECDHKNRIVILECDTAKEAWDTLFKVHGSNFQKKANLRSALNYGHIRPGMSNYDYAIELYQKELEVAIKNTNESGISKLSRDFSIIYQIVEKLGAQWPAWALTYKTAMIIRADRNDPLTMPELLSAILMQEACLPEKYDNKVYQDERGDQRYWFSGKPVMRDDEL